MEAPANLREVVRFGDFELRLSSAELIKFGLKIRLQEQPFQILVMLLGRPGGVVTREELRAKLWPGDKTFVDFEVGLNSAVLRLRNALGDTAEHSRFIETVPRRGYRFIATLEEPEAISEAAAQNFTPVEDSPPSPAVEQKVLEVAAQPVAHPHEKKLWIPRTAAAAAIVAVVVVLNWNTWRQHSLARSTSPHIQSLAVLQLDNLTGDPGQNYFVEGMTEELTTDLAKISALRVISRTSAMQYKNTNKTLPQIAKELDVDAVIEGSVERSGQRVRIVAQLLDARNDKHLWADSFERDQRDVLTLNDDVARAIAQEVKAKLTPPEEVSLQRTESVDPETYALYLKGRYFWNQRGEDPVRKSINYFQQAIRRSPNYALAYAGLAEAYVVSSAAPQEAFSAAKAAARRALELDDSLAEAHNALAVSLFWYDWDWTGAEKEFQRALALNPNYAQAHQWYGQLQKALGRKSWIDEVKRAGELDPLSVSDWGSGWYFENGQYDVLLERTRKKLELYPNAPSLYSTLSMAYLRKQMYREAIENAQKSVALSAEEPRYLAGLARVYASTGKRKEALQIIEQLTLLPKRRYISPFDIATIYADLGENDLAFRLLDKALAEHSPGLVRLKNPAVFETLHSDPRYAELERRVGLPL